MFRDFIIQIVIYISLDTFRDRADNEIKTELDAWLTFFTAEKPEDVLRLLNLHPEFLGLYQDITEFRKNPGEVIGMISEALLIMDRNSVKYYEDDVKELLSRKDKKIKEQSHQIEEKDRKIQALEEEITRLRNERQT